MTTIIAQLKDIGLNISAIITALENSIETPPPPTPAPPPNAIEFTVTDLRAVMPHNARPDDPWLKARGRTDWWTRRLDQIKRVTIHHIGSHASAAQVAAYITRPVAQGGKGLPRTQYHYHITPDGEVQELLDLTRAPWHDGGGDQNTGISIGLAGALHTRKPPLAQLLAAVTLTAWLLEDYGIDRGNVNGHDEWSRRFGAGGTQCPGWTSAGWRLDFFDALDALIPRPESAIAFSAPGVVPLHLLELDALTRGDQ